MEGLVSTEEWASIRLTQPEIWDRIFNSDKWSDVASVLRTVPDLKSHDAAWSALANADVDAAIRAVRLGNRRFASLDKTRQQALTDLRQKTIEKIGNDPGALPGIFGPDSDASMGTGAAGRTALTAINRGLSGINVADDGSLADLRCSTWSDPITNAILVTDYSDFPNADPAALAMAIDPRNWPEAKPDFFKKLDLITPPKPLPKGGYQVTYDETVEFSLVDGTSQRIRTRLVVGYRGTPDDAENLPTMWYRLAPGGDGEVLTDDGQAVISLLHGPDPTYRIESTKNVSFADPVYTVLSKMACLIWPQAIKDTVENAESPPLQAWNEGSEILVEEQEVEEDTSETDNTEVATGSAIGEVVNVSTDETRRVEAVGSDNRAGGSTSRFVTSKSVALGAVRKQETRQEEALPWTASHVDAVANFMGRVAQGQIDLSSRLATRWANGKEVTLDQVADDSIEVFELNTDLVEEGAKLTVQVLERLAKAFTTNAKDQQ